MDFGLDKFIEMFEERFGRKVTTALLVLIGVGIASVMVHLIWTNLIRPIYSYTKSINLFGFAAHAGGFSWSDAANFGLSLFFGFCVLNAMLLTVLAIFSIWKSVIDDISRSMKFEKERKAYEKKVKLMKEQSQSKALPASALPVLEQPTPPQET
jgi:hypothetical protein